MFTEYRLALMRTRYYQLREENNDASDQQKVNITAITSHSQGPTDLNGNNNTKKLSSCFSKCFK